MKTMIENSEKLTKILNLLNEEADWQPYTASIWGAKGDIKLQGFWGSNIAIYLLENGYKRQNRNNGFVELNNGDGIEIVLT